MLMKGNMINVVQRAHLNSVLSLEAIIEFGKFLKRAERRPGSWKGRQDIVPHFFALRSLLFLGVKMTDYGQLSEKLKNELTLVKV